MDDIRNQTRKQALSLILLSVILTSFFQVSGSLLQNIEHEENYKWAMMGMGT